MISFFIPGPPVGKGRPRATRSGRMYTPAKTVKYESLVALAAHEAMLGAIPLSGPVRVTINIFCEVAQSWSQKKKNAALDGTLKPTGKPDFDNIAKAVADAMNGVIYQDDKQIVWALITKQYSATPGVEVHVSNCI